MKLYEGVGKMTNDDYISIARNDSTWQQIAASFAIEGLKVTEENEVIAGKMIAGEIDLADAIRMIRASAGVPVEASELMPADSLH